MPNPQLSRSNRTTGSGGGNGGGKTPPNSPKKKSSSKKKKRITGKRVFWTLFFTAAFAVLCALGGYLFITINGEKILASNKDKIEIKAPTVIYDRTGVQIGEVKIQRGEEVPAEDIPKLLQEAFVATEDKRFFEHSGVDLRSIGRAAVRDVVARSAVEGGSTITQQLAKNIFLSSDKTFFRKATEVSIALALERNYKKPQILAMYLNRIPFGGQYYGIKAASERYFGQSDLNKLKLWQVATLAAMPKAPTRYNPIANPDKSKERRGVVLQLMYEQGYITEKERDEAAKINYNYKPPETKDTHYQAFIDYVLQEAEDATALSEDDLNRGGYKIYTTMDAKAQQTLEEAFKDDSLFEDSPDDQPVQASMVITNSKNGSVIAMLGARNYHKGDYNRAVNSRRQPGSSFKPIAAYAPALDSGQFTVDSPLNNEQQSFGNYSPKNLHGYSGTVSMKEALAESINIPAVWLLNQIGVETGFQFAESLGIPLTEKDHNLAIALGGLATGTNTLEMATAYNSFANGGKFNEAYAIKSIQDSNQIEIYSRIASTKQVMSAETAYEMTQMMESVVTDGTGRKADIGRPLAGKTGTTQSGLPGNSGNRDVWFVGYTPEWTGAVWMGYDKPDGEHMLKNSSGLAASMFARVMSKALEGTPASDFKAPDSPAAEAPVEQPPAEPETKEPVGSPSGLVASYDVNREAVMLSWQPVSGENVRYRLYRQEASEAQPSLLSDGLNSPSADDPSALAGLTYSYAVTAYRAGEDPIVESGASNTVSLTVPADDNPEEVVPDLPEETVPPEETEEDTPAPDEGTTVPPADNGQNGGTDNGGTGGDSGTGGDGGNNGNNGNNGNTDNGGTDSGGDNGGTTVPGTTSPDPGTGGTNEGTPGDSVPGAVTPPDSGGDTQQQGVTDPAAVDPNASGGTGDGTGGAADGTVTQP
ncbi:PBP1A family penicillin-binding protein [Saccharibacillus sp. CPCC 101409]|uniref:PBP1A family penicillin-binding protein n=1 Tax=Saccharibacillus sp. CPCC 101409 TaxID=3058041 RepID=UPI002672D910|nr:PBP1A family penicillin-binding protein [Saccharibacillus sp. CPCC 101409]MDO3412818.1 PBP1A family penicillin-binding protein [Saccharibacillus sp. CPCC 101409]